MQAIYLHLNQSWIILISVLLKRIFVIERQFTNFLKKKDQTSLDNISLVQQKTNARADAMKLETVSEGKVSYEQQKERAKLAKKAEKRVKDAELTVEKIENEIGAIEQQLATPEGATSVNLFEQHAALKKQLDKAVEEWELAMEAYSEFDW